MVIKQKKINSDPLFCRQNEEFAEEMTEEEARRRWDAVVASLERLVFL